MQQADNRVPPPQRLGHLDSVVVSGDLQSVLEACPPTWYTVSVGLIQEFFPTGRAAGFLFLKEPPEMPYRTTLNP